MFHSVTFLVPSFDPDYIMWPSYEEKLNRHYNLVVGPAPCPREL